MSRGAALTDALLVTLATPATWPMALGAFLLRGGFLVVLVPIVVLPSPVSLGNVLGPTLMTVVLSGVPLELGLAFGLVALAVLAWVVVGGLIAATLEAEGARLVAGEDDGAVRDRVPAGTTTVRDAIRILAVRLVAHAPTTLALFLGSTRLVAVAYRELTSPADVTSPIAVRVVLGAPEAIVVILLVWMLGEIVGAVAARRVALGGADVTLALREALMAVIRRPLVALVGFSVPAAGLALVVVPSALAAAVAWGAVRAAMGSLADPIGPTLAVLLFVVVWMVGLLLLGVTTAWRGAVWSVADRAVWGRRGEIEVAAPG